MVCNPKTLPACKVECPLILKNQPILQEDVLKGGYVEEDILIGGIKQIIYRRGYNQRGDIIGGIKILEWIFRGD